MNEDFILSNSSLLSIKNSEFSLVIIVAALAFYSNIAFSPIKVPTRFNSALIVPYLSSTYFHIHF